MLTGMCSLVYLAAFVLTGMCWLVYLPGCVRADKYVFAGVPGYIPVDRYVFAGVPGCVRGGEGGHLGGQPGRGDRLTGQRSVQLPLRTT